MIDLEAVLGVGIVRGDSTIVRGEDVVGHQQPSDGWLEGFNKGS